MKGRQIKYSDEELAWIKARRKMPRRELHAAFVAQFGRDDVLLMHIKALCTRKGWKTGRTGCFSGGHKPHNKGKHFSPKGSEKGRFKPGNLPHNTRELYHESVRSDGYVYISVPNPDEGFERVYVLKHKWLWEKEHGPLPDGYCLKSKDGDRTNTDPSNWEAVPRAILPRLAGGRWCKPYEEYEPEVRPAVMAIAKLEHAARERKER